MEVIGLFRELVPSADASSVGIRDLIGQISDQERAPIVTYLRNAVPVFDVMGAEHDPFDKSVCISGAPSLISDGYWIWRYDLEYYVDRYKIELNRAFVEMVVSGHRKYIVDATVQAKWAEILRCYDAACRRFGSKCGWLSGSA